MKKDEKSQMYYEKENVIMMPLGKLIFVVAILHFDFLCQGREESKIFNRRWTHFNFSHFSPIFLRDQILH